MSPQQFGMKRRTRRCQYSYQLSIFTLSHEVELFAALRMGTLPKQREKHWYPPVQNCFTGLDIAR